MPLVRIPRSPTLFWTALACVVVAHLVLCHPAATSRGYPPPGEQQLIWMFIAPFFIGFPALFDDRTASRRRGVLVGSIGMALIYGIVLANLHTARPHIGHRVGMLGVVRTCWSLILPFAIGPFALLWMSLTIYERVTGDCWSWVRSFCEGDADDASC